MGRARIALFSGRTHPDLAATVPPEPGNEPGGCILETFPDHEFRVQEVEREQALVLNDNRLLRTSSGSLADFFLEMRRNRVGQHRRLFAPFLKPENIRTCLDALSRCQAL
jgi:hypothetical protein